jgi:hypothetical protein
VPEYIRTLDSTALEVNADETKYMFVSRHQKAGQNHDIKTANSSNTGNGGNKSKLDSGGN